MTTLSAVQKMPPLPCPALSMPLHGLPQVYLFTAEQMLEYAQLCMHSAPVQPIAQGEREAFDAWFMEGAYGNRPYDRYAEAGLSEDEAFALFQSARASQPSQPDHTVDANTMMVSQDRPAQDSAQGEKK